MAFDLKEAQQIIEVNLQTSHSSGIELSPDRGEAPVIASSLPVIGSMVDLIEGLFHHLLILFIRLIQDVSRLVSPTGLVGDDG